MVGEPRQFPSRYRVMLRVTRLNIAALEEFKAGSFVFCSCGKASINRVFWFSHKDLRNLMLYDGRV